MDESTFPLNSEQNRDTENKNANKEYGAEKEPDGLLFDVLLGFSGHEVLYYQINN